MFSRLSPRDEIIPEQRMRAAGQKLIDAHTRVVRAADKLNVELDETTSPHGIPIAELSNEDSMVIVVDLARAANGK